MKCFYVLVLMGLTQILDGFDRTKTISLTTHPLTVGHMRAQNQALTVEALALQVDDLRSKLAQQEAQLRAMAWNEKVLSKRVAALYDARRLWQCCRRKYQA